MAKLGRFRTAGAWIFPSNAYYFRKVQLDLQLADSRREDEGLV